MQAGSASDFFSNNLVASMGIQLTQASHPSYGNYVDTLPIEMRTILNESSMMGRLFKNFDTSFYCLEQIKERVKCYKVGLGTLMEELLGSVKAIVDKILVSTLKTIEEHKQTNDKMMEKNLEAVNSILEEKRFYEQRTKQLLLYCEVLKEQKEYFAKNLEATKSHVEYMEQREKNLTLALTGGEDVLSRQTDDFYKKRQESLESIRNFLKNLTVEFNSTIQDWQEHYNSKKGDLLQMEEVLRSMMIGEKTDKECQVNELELKWGVENVANLDAIQNEFYENSVKLHGAGISYDSALDKLKPNDNLEKLEVQADAETRMRVGDKLS
jgi:hypothetical protein